MALPLCTSDTGTSPSVMGTPSVVSARKTPRKVPHCTKCHHPWAGHPYQGCPFVSSTSSDASHIQELSQALRSLTVSESVRHQEISTRPKSYVAFCLAFFELKDRQVASQTSMITMLRIPFHGKGKTQSFH